MNMFRNVPDGTGMHRLSKYFPIFLRILQHSSWFSSCFPGLPWAVGKTLDCASGDLYPGASTSSTTVYPESIIHIYHIYIIFIYIYIMFII